MDKTILLQLAGSMAIVTVLAGFSAWLRAGRTGAVLDEARASLLLADEFPAHRIDKVWITQDGKGAVARSADSALVLIPVATGYACRRMPWSMAVSALFRNGRLSIHLDEAPAPHAVLAFDNWPPQNLAA